MERYEHTRHWCHIRKGRRPTCRDWEILRVFSEWRHNKTMACCMPLPFSNLLSFKQILKLMNIPATWSFYEHSKNRRWNKFLETMDFGWYMQPIFECCQNSKIKNHLQVRHESVYRNPRISGRAMSVYQSKLWKIFRYSVDRSYHCSCSYSSLGLPISRRHDKFGWSHNRGIQWLAILQ